MMKKLFLSLFLVAFATCAITVPVEAAKARKHTKSKKKAKAEPIAKNEKKAAPTPVQESEENVIVMPGASLLKLKAKQAILIDYATGTVLLERNADEKMTPSSMVKMMTAYVIEEKLQKNQANPDTLYHVSEKAWRMGGTKMFVPLGEAVSLSDLLKGIIIQSGNDACIVAAEGISGSEDNFVQEMNAKAMALGLKNTVFKNSSGWPEEGQYSTARDLAILGARIIRDFPKSYELYKETKFTYNKIEQGNRNPLLYKNFGCDGIKTGHSDAGGYGIAASFVDNGVRYIMVINGLPTLQSRADEAIKIVTWAKQNFINRTIFKRGDIAEKAAPTWLGEKETVSLVAGDDVKILVPRTDQNKVEIKVVYDSPIHAPVKAGMVVGKILISSPSMKHEIPLISAEDCEKVGLLTRFWRSIQYLLWGKA